MVTFMEQSNDSMIFLASQIQGQAELERYLNEAILMSEGKNTIDNMMVVNEGFIESVKNGLNKIAAFLKKMWNRFLEAMNSLIRTNKGYLEKYKDTILKNKIKDDVSYDMFNWKEGVPNIKMGLNMTYSNEEQLMKDFADKDGYIKSHFGNMLQGFKPPYSDIWGDMCKAFFHGGQNTMEANAGELTGMLKDMYDYCYNYESAVKNIIQKDFDQFMDNAGKQLEALNKAQNSGQFKESTNIWESGEYYSPIYEYYLTEDTNPNDFSKYQNMTSEQIRVEANKARGAGNNDLADRLNTLAKSKETDSKSKNPVQKPNEQQSTNKNNTDQTGRDTGSAVKKDATTDQSTANGAQKSDVNNDNNKLNVDTSKAQNLDELKKLSEAVQAYVNIGQLYLTNRMSAAEGAYKDYMKIMKEHVKDIVGNQNPAQKTAGAVKNDNSKTGEKQNGGTPEDTNNNQGSTENGFK